jgi:hypothetical protein
MNKETIPWLTFTGQLKVEDYSSFVPTNCENHQFVNKICMDQWIQIYLSISNFNFEPFFSLPIRNIVTIQYDC